LIPLLKFQEQVGDLWILIFVISMHFLKEIAVTPNAIQELLLHVSIHFLRIKA
jgi:hypothetical protein